MTVGVFLQARDSNQLVMSVGLFVGDVNSSTSIEGC